MRSKPKYDLLFYSDAQGNSELMKWMDDLQARSQVKNNRILLAKIRHLFSLLEVFGPRLTMPECRKLVAVQNPPLWEIRILTVNQYRIFWTLWQGNILLLHWFRKETAKTPKHEIQKAQHHFRDWIKRYGE